MTTIYISGDPYEFDPDSGEWIERHHVMPSHTGSHG